MPRMGEYAEHEAEEKVREARYRDISRVIGEVLVEETGAEYKHNLVEAFLLYFQQIENSHGTYFRDRNACYDLMRGVEIIGR